MYTRNFHELLRNRWNNDHLVCVGLDSDSEKIPEQIRRVSHDSAQFAFNADIVRKTYDLVCAYKPNLQFYLAKGSTGIANLKHSVENIRKVAPDVPIILDAKSGDIGNTNDGSAEFAFEYLGVDAVTVNPYLGGSTLAPFLKYKNKGIIVLCRTSNPGAGEFQDRVVQITDEEAKKWSLPKGLSIPLYQLVAYRVSREWNTAGNCLLVVGATCPEELADVREIVGDMPLLIPGIGAQGGDIKATVENGQDSRGQGMIINSSRGIIFSADPRAATVELRNLINGYRRT